MLRDKLTKLNRINYSKFSSVYAEKLYKRWVEDNTQVSAEWNNYFRNQKIHLNLNQSEQQQLNQSQQQEINEQVAKLYALIRAYRYRGHEEAEVDPLQLDSEAQKQSGYKQREKYLEYSKFGFSEQDLDKVIITKPNDLLGYFLKEQQQWTVRQIIEKMQQIYCGNVGYEFLHISEEENKKWIRRQIEENKFNDISIEDKKATFESLLKNHQFNEFMKNTFSTSKRFGIEGLDSMISGLDALVKYSGNHHQMQHMILGMAHRGRLNTLAIVFDKPYDEIFAEFQDLKGDAMIGVGGDVKYHLGTTIHKQLKNNNMELTILPNPSHLETVNPVVYGTTRAIQDFTKDSNANKAFGVIIHGDAAFAGQGVVYESLQFQNLKDYTSGGIVHIISNNQIGFTTTPTDARTGLYCTEVAKCIGAPIFHVNADQPDQVDRIMRLAFEYRQQFKKDVIIDIIGYRKFGHNELDQPSFTQPLMYKKVNQMKPVYLKYKEQLLAKGVLDQQYITNQENTFYESLKKAYLNSKKTQFDFTKWQSKAWEKLLTPELLGENIKDTGIDLKTIKELGILLNNVTEVQLHPQLQKIYQARISSIEEGKGIDYATAEQLAFGTLLQEGYGIRLSGQDVERGTFSHRHAVLHDQEKDLKFIPLHKLLPKDELHKVTITNSHLSEYGVLGFEYGYSQSNPNYLVMWEAQFGDFSNEAQIMIDNYIVSCEKKWGVQTGLTLLLPHGMDGQGPEHSSARMERYLSLVDDDLSDVRIDRDQPIKQQIRNGNLQIVQCSTAAQYFHVLRRQMKRPFRKPLIVFNNKKLLRYKHACSDIQDFNLGLRFQRIIPELSNQLLPSHQITKVVVCTGQAYYEVLEKRQQLERKNVAIIRVEQIAPFPYENFKQFVSQYVNAEFIWFQEEHQNMGAWVYVEPRINLMLKELKIQVKGFQSQEIRYVGRKISSSPAAGTQKLHQMEQKQILNTLFDLN